MIIFRYLFKQIITSVVATSFILLLILVANQFIHYLNDAASGKITINAVFLVTLIQLPLLLGYILPLALFLAILLTLGRLYVDHEMVVLSACGVNQLQIVGMVMVVALFVTVVDSWLMLSVEPALFRYRTEVILQSVQEATLEKVLPGRFQSFGDAKHTLYVGEVNKAKRRFTDVFVAIQKPSAAWDVLTAKAVNQQKKPGEGMFLVFNDGFRYSGTPGLTDYQVLQFDQYQARAPIAEISVDGRYAAMPSKILFALQAHHDLDALGELEWRIVTALSTLALALLAIPLSEVNPRKGKFSQLLPAILLYVVYANMMFVSKSWLQHGQMPVWLGLWWILLALLSIALGLYLYQHGAWRRLFVRKKVACC